MGLFKSKKKVGLFSDVIRCDEPSYLIWKWRPDGKESGEHKRENAIRMGSQLRVKDGEVAVFVYKQNSGKEPDYIEGPHDQKLKTANLPVLSGVLGAFVGGDTPFQAEVYFINLAKVIQAKFAVPFFDVCDPRYPDFSVPVAVRGTISFKIKDYREFVQMHRLTTFDENDFRNQIQVAVSRYVKSAVANAPTDYNIPLIQIERKTAEINTAVEENLKERLQNDFGVLVSGVDIGEIELDKYCDEYQQLMSVSKDVTTATIHAQTAANLEHYQDSLRIQREEGQYAQHMQTKSANIAAYQIEKQAEVGVAGADALGQMGANNAGGVNLGNGVGFNPAAMMASMAVGGVVAKNLSATMNGAMSANGGIATPPPIPKTTYHVAVNGQANGPYELSAICDMIAKGSVGKETLLWKTGAPSWEKASSLEELKPYFPPDIPVNQ